MKPAPMQCNETDAGQYENDAEKVNEMSRQTIKTTEKKLKKEKQRNMENAEAGAHDHFGVLSMEGGKGKYADAGGTKAEASQVIRAS